MRKMEIYDAAIIRSFGFEQKHRISCVIENPEGANRECTIYPFSGVFCVVFINVVFGRSYGSGIERGTSLLIFLCLDIWCGLATRK